MSGRGCFPFEFNLRSDREIIYQREHESVPQFDSSMVQSQRRALAKYSAFKKPITLQCKYCEAVFGTKDDLEVHRLTDHFRQHEPPTPKELAPPYGAFSFDLEKINGRDVLDSHRLGVFRGIQGENNSCYLDAALVAMFYANSTYDSLIDGTHRCHSVELEYSRTFLARHIVNSLRRRGFVPSALVVEWRRMMNNYYGGVDFDGNCQQQEASDFVDFLLKTFGGADRQLGFSFYRSEVSCEDDELCYMLQLLPPEIGSTDGGDSSTNRLLHETLRRQDLAFAYLGQSLILQLPRYGARGRLLSYVEPDRYISLKTTTSGEECFFELSAVLVIGTAHFVTYLHVVDQDDDLPPQWLFYDSMSDRIGDQNVPILTNVTVALNDPRDPHYHRVTRDMSLAFYRRVCEPQFKDDVATQEEFSYLASLCHC